MKILKIDTSGVRQPLSSSLMNWQDGQIGASERINWLIPVWNWNFVVNIMTTYLFDPVFPPVLFVCFPANSVCSNSHFWIRFVGIIAASSPIYSQLCLDFQTVEIE
jgi:hypothetical protein